MAITIINQTTHTDNFSVLINGKKVDTLIPNETLLVALPEEPATLSFRWSRIKPIQVRHDDVIVLTDHKVNAFLRNKRLYIAFIPIWIALMVFMPKSEMFNNNEAFFRARVIWLITLLVLNPSICLPLGRILTPSFVISQS